MKFLVVSIKNLALCQSYNNLFNALMFRRDYPCVVYSSDSVELLHFLARQGSSRMYYMQQSSECKKLVVPPVSAGCYAIETRVDNMINPKNLISVDGISYGTWAISGINGFAIASTIEELITVLASQKLVYAIAVWCGTEDKALAVARREYVRRFFQRYSAEDEEPPIPMMVVSSFVDKFFSERELRLGKLPNSQKKLLEKLYQIGW